MIGETSVTSCRIGHLFGGTWYSVYLLTYVKNKRIKSAKSEIVKVKTLESGKSGAFISYHSIKLDLYFMTLHYIALKYITINCIKLR